MLDCHQVVLAPLRQYGLRAVNVTTLQAVSGAGYPGVPSLDILGNVVPFIGGEEEKMESETKKILARTLPAMPRTSGSSAFSTAVPPGFKPSTICALPSAIASTEPMNSRCTGDSARE